MTSRSRVEKMAINTFSHSRLWPSWRGGPVKKMKLPRQLPSGVKSSTPPGGNALIYAVDVAMSVECIQCCCRATKAPVANKTQLIMCCPKVVYNGPLILP